MSRLGQPTNASSPIFVMGAGRLSSTEPESATNTGSVIYRLDRDGTNLTTFHTLTGAEVLDAIPSLNNFPTGGFKIKPNERDSSEFLPSP